MKLKFSLEVWGTLNNQRYDVTPINFIKWHGNFFNLFEETVKAQMSYFFVLFKEMPRQMMILLDFIKVNRLRLVDWFFRFDKDHSGDISREEFKTGLKETGLKMTQVQMFIIN